MSYNIFISMHLLENNKKPLFERKVICLKKYMLQKVKENFGFKPCQIANKGKSN